MKNFPDFYPFLILIVASLILSFLDSINFLKYPKIAASLFTTPVQFGIYKSSQNLREQFIFIKNTKDLSFENKTLKLNLAKLISENTMLKEQLEEVKVESSQIKFMDPKVYKLIPARPIGLDRYLHIDKGSNDGVKLNQVVVFENNFVGKIVSVSPKTSNVALITDPDIKISSFSQNLEGKAKGIILGQFGSEILFDKILQEEKIKVGDLVFSDGLEEFIPRGLILGKVVLINGKSSDIFKQAKVKPIIDIRDLNLIFVILE